MEFLRVDRCEFNLILRRSHEEEARRKFLIMRAHAFFRGWPDKELNDAVPCAQLRSYVPRAVVLDGFHSHPGELVGMVVTGGVRIVRRVPVRTRSDGGVVALASNSELFQRSLQAKESVLSMEDTYKHILMTADSLLPGSMFACWSQSTSIVCSTKSTCLLISKVIFMRHDHGRCLDAVRGGVPMLFMEDKQLFDSYKKQRAWEQYRKYVMKEATKYKSKYQQSPIRHET